MYSNITAASACQSSLVSMHTVLEWPVLVIIILLIIEQTSSRSQA